MAPIPPVDPSREELERHGAWLRRLARSLVYDRAGADDLVQAAWLAALRRGAPGEGTLGAWLAGAVRRLARQDARASARRRRREREAARPEAVGDPHDALARLEVARLLVEAVQGLEEPYRTTLTGHFIEGLSMRRVAQRRGVPLETARTHLKRGLERVRRRLDAERSGRREELLGVLVPLAGPTPFALELWESVLGKVLWKGAGAMGIGAKVGSVAAGVLAVSIGLWFLRGDPPVPRSEPALARGAPTRDAAPVPDPLSTPQASADRALAEPMRDSALERAPVDALAGDPPVLEPGLVARALTGHVHDPEGRPIVGALVSVAGFQVSTDAQGGYRLEFPDGRNRVHIEVSARGWAPRAASIELRATPEPLLLDFELRREFRAVGRVEDELGWPVEGAEVSSFFTHGNETTTGPDGTYALGSLDPGRPSHLVSARKVGFVLASEEVETRGAEEAELVLRLSRGVRVEGRVLDESGEPLPGAELYIGFSPHAYDRLDATAGEHGAFRFPAVGRGEQTLVTKVAGRAPDSRQILVPAEGEVLAGLEIVLADGRRLAGRVVDEEGEGLAGFSIRVRHRGLYLDLGTRTDAEGRFELEHLEPGRYRLVATRFDPGTSLRWHGEAPVQIATGERAEAWIRVAPR